MQSLHEVVLQGVRIKIGKGTAEGFGDVPIWRIAYWIWRMSTQWSC